MKPLKKASQRNAELNKMYYGNEEVRKMVETGECFIIEEDPCRISHDPLYAEDKNVRIMLDDKKEIKVILDQYGNYTTVCVNTEGKQYFITLN